MDAWFEEDEQVFTHPRDPYTRVDILPSSRHVRIEVDGVTIAETAKPTLLFETGLPVRYYLPKTHVRMDLLTPTESASHCPYKGEAEYWSLRVGDDVCPRRGVVVPDAAAREPEDRRADQLLPGEGRPLRRRRPGQSSDDRIGRSDDRRFEQLLDRATDPAFILDPLEDRFVAANAAGCAMLGYPLEELLETPVSRIHPGELSQLQEFVGGVLRVVTARRSGSPAGRGPAECLPIEMSLWAFGTAAASACSRSFTIAASTAGCCRVD